MEIKEEEFNSGSNKPKTSIFLIDRKSDSEDIEEADISEDSSVITGRWTVAEHVQFVEGTSIL